MLHLEVHDAIVSVREGQYLLVCRRKKGACLLEELGRRDLAVNQELPDLGGRELIHEAWGRVGHQRFLKKSGFTTEPSVGS